MGRSLAARGSLRRPEEELAHKAVLCYTELGETG